MAAAKLLQPVKGRFWRVVPPVWGHDPISGVGASLQGGRWNRPGQVAIYAALEFLTAVGEYWQELASRPGTFFAIDVAVANVLDVRKPAVGTTLGMTRADLLCAWQKMWFFDDLEPPTWRGCDVARKSGANGLLIPSSRVADGSSLVLWDWTAESAELLIFDPNREMPRAPA